MKRILVFIVMLSSVAASAQPKRSPLDVESKVHFVIKNFGINTGGDLKGLKGDIVFEKDKLASSYVDVKLDVSSIDTDNKRRDAHLVSSDYFDAGKYPYIHIVGKPVAGAVADEYVLKAKLTIKDVTRQVDIPFTVVADGTGFLFKSTFEINRQDYNVGGNSAMLSDNVKVLLNIVAK